MGREMWSGSEGIGGFMGAESMDEGEAEVEQSTLSVSENIAGAIEVMSVGRET